MPPFQRQINEIYFLCVLCVSSAAGGENRNSNQVQMMEEQKYGDWSLEVHQRLAGKRIPIGGSIELTQRCNNKCVHCYNNLAAGDNAALESELSLDEHCRIIDEIADFGCLWLLLTGGEIFLRRDFLDIYSYAKQKGLLVTLFTNGTLINAATADYLAQLEALKQSLQSQQTAYQTRTKELNTQITAAENELNDLQRDLKDLQLQLSQLQTTRIQQATDYQVLLQETQTRYDQYLPELQAQLEETRFELSRVNQQLQGQ